jgi:transcriptional regulator with XRE-family HTH domain
MDAVCSVNSPNPYWAESVTANPIRLYSAPMPWKWAAIRSEFIRRRGKRAQGAIARSAHLHQSAISKLENNDNLGPAVEIFLNAIDGLGVSVADFFDELERSQNQPLQSGEPLGDTAASNPSREASHGSGSVSAASHKQDLARLRKSLQKIEADLRRMEARDRNRAAARGKKAKASASVRPSRTKVS